MEGDKGGLALDGLWVPCLSSRGPRPLGVGTIRAEFAG